jgi:hypothetical protein
MSDLLTQWLCRNAGDKWLRSGRTALQQILSFGVEGSWKLATWNTRYEGRRINIRRRSRRFFRMRSLLLPYLIPRDASILQIKYRLHYFEIDHRYCTALNQITKVFLWSSISWDTTPCSPLKANSAYSTLKIEAICPSETSVDF